MLVRRAGAREVVTSYAFERTRLPAQGFGAPGFAMTLGHDKGTTEPKALVHKGFCNVAGP